MFADRLVKKIINDIINNKDKIPDTTRMWRSDTRLMFMNYEAWQVWEWVTQASEEAADENWFERKYPKGFFKESFEFPKRKSVIKLNSKGKRIRKMIDDKIKIIDIAKGYGLKIKNGKALCPFHDDKEPSLGFSDEKNIFHCFGCNAKGDIVEFVRRMDIIKNG